MGHVVLFSWVLRKGIPREGTFEGRKKEVNLRCLRGHDFKPRRVPGPWVRWGGEQLQGEWCVGESWCEMGIRVGG